MFSHHPSKYYTKIRNVRANKNKIRLLPLNMAIYNVLFQEEHRLETDSIGFMAANEFSKRLQNKIPKYN